MNPLLFFSLSLLFFCYFIFIISYLLKNQIRGFCPTSPNRLQDEESPLKWFVRVQ